MPNSDHLGIKTEIQMRGTSEAVRNPCRTVWHYSHADWGKAREKIEAFD